MVSSVLINPSLPDDMLFRSAEEVCTYISSDRDKHLESFDVKEQSDYVIAIGLDGFRDHIGDTTPVFIDHKKGRTYKMVYIDFQGNHVTARPQYNLLASILHHEGRKIYGRAMLVCVANKDTELYPCVPDDVLHILYRRAWHHGIWFPEGDGGVPQQVEIDNRWIVRGKGDMCISEWHKAYCSDKQGRPMLKVSKDKEFFLFALLDNAMLIDLFVDEFVGLR